MEPESTLSNYPQRIDHRNWYYEEMEGLRLVHQVCDKDKGVFLQRDEILIPWRKIKQSLKRLGGE